MTFDFLTVPGFAASPVVEPGNELIGACRRLGGSQAAAILRAWCVLRIILAREAIFDSNQEPVAALGKLFAATARLYNDLAETGLAALGRPASDVVKLSAPSVETVTGEHYGNLFREFSQESYWDEPVRLLRTRLERNDIDVRRLAGRAVLDVWVAAAQ